MISNRFTDIVGAALLVLAMLATAAEPAAAQVDPDLYNGLQWRLIGPFRAGRTVAVSGVPGQPSVFYMAANDGGIWKSENYGRTWAPLFKRDENNSIGALAIAPSAPNVIYAGSGEGLLRPDLSVGDGIYKSSDAGKTWRHLGLRAGQQIASIIVDPHDAKRLFVAVLGHPYGPNAQRGVYRSTDGGQTFRRVLYKGENVGAVQVAFDPANPQIVYAVLWAGRQTPWTNFGPPTEGFAGTGLYRSIDGGSTWHRIGNGLPTQSQGLGRIGIGIAPSDADRIYAQVQAPPEFGGTYVSDDAGLNFRRINHEPRIYGRGFDFAEIEVAPDNPDEVYVCNTSTYRSMDGGRTFTAIKGAPGGDDYHRIWINPDNPDIMILGADQGATISVDGGKSWSSWYNQPTAQSYHVITDNGFPYHVYSSQQESGSVGISSRGNDGEITFRDWHPVGAGEYAYIAPDPLHPDIIYGGKVTRYNRLTGQTQFVGPVLGRGQYRFNRTAPLLFSPVDPHVLYLGSNVLFKTSNGGQSWQIISPDLSRPDPGVPATLGPFGEHVNALDHRGVIYSIGPSFRDVNTLWAGTDDGLIWITHDGGKSWKNVTPPRMTGWSKVTQIVASHFDDRTAYVSVSRFRLDDLKPYIYRTHDGGKTWKLIVDGLPDNALVNVVREDPVRKGLLIAGTEQAVWFSVDDGDHWNSLQLNLPKTSMRDLVIHGDDVVLGTHGRSLWILDDISPLRQLSEAAAAQPAYLFAPAPAYQVPRDTNTDTPLPPETAAGRNPPNGAIIDYYLKVPATGAVTLAIYDASGKLVRQFASTDKPVAANPDELNVPVYWLKRPSTLATRAGMHRFVWDLHYPTPAGPGRPPIAAVPHATPLGPLGPAALPGQYTVKLTVNGHTLAQPLTVTVDPRNKTPEAGLTKHFALSMQVMADMGRVYKALRATKADSNQAQALQKLGDRLEQLYSTGEMSEIAPGPPTAQMIKAVATLHAEVVKTTLPF